MANPYEGLGGAENDAKAWAWRKFNEILGRDPTQSELAQATPVFMGSDKNITDVAAGTAFVSSIANSPDAVYKRQQEQYGKEAPGKYGEVDQQVQALLGRGATQEEKDYFGKLLASGQVDAYQLQNFLKQDQEYMTRQDQQFREGLSSELQQGDARYFQEQIMPSIQSQFAKQGRSVDATGFQNALAREGTAQNRQREQFLANLSAKQYGGRSANARADYEGYYNQLAGRQQASLTAPYARQNELMDYTMQKNAYEDYLRRYGKRSKGQAIGALAGGVLGAATGAMSGTPWGVGAGWQAGSGLGGGIGSMWG